MLARLVLVFTALTCGCAMARDLGQWEQSSPEQRAWFQSLMQPDTYPYPVSCCGDADGYWADRIVIEGDNVYAVVTDDRDDTPLKRTHVDVGKRFLIPPKKIVGRIQPGNPTGHAWLFLGEWSWVGNQKTDRAVLCYVPNGGF